jgi:ABC-type oligopeptide transport system substrate-binding subunit
MRLDMSYQVLRVGMRELPRYLSPARAVTDADRRAVDLLFESLVDLGRDSDGALYYRPGLAEGRIKVVPLGREFRLPRGARWSDGEELTASDLSFTVELLRSGLGTGRNSAWGQRLEKVRVEGDPYRVKLMMNQGFIDPLALMSFKVVPARTRGAKHPDSEEFAQRPITSGPFELGERGEFAGRSSIAFRASAQYGARADRQGRPAIQEIHFLRTTDPVKDLEAGTIDLALDLTAEQAATLLKSDKYDVPLPGAKSVNHRIWFLAVNHRKAVLEQADFRLALAQAINRVELLKKHFRGNKEELKEVHRVLSGPYPAGSWACKPDLKADPYDRATARTRLKRVLAKLGSKEVVLTVKYPAGDPATEAAVIDLCARVSKDLPGVKLKAESCSPRDLREAVEDTHSYELAYYHYDYPDEAFWLMPLLGPSGRSGSAENYLGYNGGLVTLIQEATNRRHFTQVRDYAHRIHQQFLQSEMPFIPLWQLDPLYASKKGAVEMGPVDPGRIFARIDQWRVKRGE